MQYPQKIKEMTILEQQELTAVIGNEFFSKVNLNF